GSPRAGRTSTPRAPTTQPTRSPSARWSRRTAGKRSSSETPRTTRRPISWKGSEGRERPSMKLLIVRLSAMGDVIHTLPLAANARAAGADVGWVIERGFAGVLQGNPDVGSLFVADTQGWRRR